MPEHRQCAFCGNNAVKITGEHIFSAWIGRLLGSKEYTWKFVDPETRAVRLWNSSLDNKVKFVCKPCNEGWMSQLETEAKKELSDIIAGRKEVALSVRGAATLAEFTFKNAIIANYMNTRQEPFFSPAVRKRFATTLEIPANVQMWLGAFGGIHKSGTYKSYVSGPTTPGYQGILKDFEIHAFTFGAGGLITQLLASRWRPVHKRGLPLPGIYPNEIFDKASVQFWPSTGRLIDWPPPEYFDDDSIEQFTNRWAGPVRII